MIGGSTVGSVADMSRHETTLPKQPRQPLLTRADVERVYGVSKRFLELAPARGEGPRFVRIGRSVRYRPEDVEAWLETLVVDPTDGRR